MRVAEHFIEVWKPMNLVSLCATHHLRGVHMGRLRVSGTAPDRLHWELGVRAGAAPLVDLVVPAAARGSCSTDRGRGLRGPDPASPRPWRARAGPDDRQRDPHPERDAQPDTDGDWTG